MDGVHAGHQVLSETVPRQSQRFAASSTTGTRLPVNLSATCFLAPPLQTTAANTNKCHQRLSAYDANLRR